MSTLRKQTYLTQHSISGPLQSLYCTDYACGWWREPIYAESVQTEEQISRRFSESGSETNWPAIKPLANYSHRYSACLKKKSRHSNNLHKVSDDLQQLFCCYTPTVCLGLVGKARNKLIAIDNQLILVSDNIFKGTILISLRGPSVRKLWLVTVAWVLYRISKFYINLYKHHFLNYNTKYVPISWLFAHRLMISNNPSQYPSTYETCTAKQNWLSISHTLTVVLLHCCVSVLSISSPYSNIFYFSFFTLFYQVKPQITKQFKSKNIG